MPAKILQINFKVNIPVEEYQQAAHPGLSDISVKVFDVMDDVTATCRGPV